MTDPKSRKDFSAHYYGEKGSERKLATGEEAQAIVDAVIKSEPVVENVKIGTQKRNPQPPFTTSTLQQDASRKYGFQASKTMQIAQTLYEGVNLGGRLGSIGLITYMRTDSLRISDEAQQEVVDYIKSEYGDEYANPKQYKTKKNAQDAHEAIRPTSVSIKPIDIKEKLTNDQYRLYKLIWERFTASQMSSAIYDTISAVIDASGHTFRASGSQLRFKGYMAVYVESSDKKEEKRKMLPKLEKISL